MSIQNQLLRHVRGNMGRLENSSNQFRVFFLMQFTKEVLKNSASYDVETLEKILKRRTKDIISRREKEKEKNKLEIEELLQRRRTYIKPSIKSIDRQILKPSIKSEVKVVKKSIEENENKNNKSHILSPVRPRMMQSHIRRQIPERIQGVNIPIPSYMNVMPAPTNEKIDLGDLNAYLDDPTIATIECNGPDTLLLVRRGRDIRKTDFALTKDQIQEILVAFSKASRIPINEGVFRVAVGRVILTAQISGEFGTKFILSKMF